MTKKTDQNGNALMIVMVLFVVISLSIAAGLIAPILRSHRIATNNIESKKSYFLAESGIEDALYRLHERKIISSTENIVLGSRSTTTTITNLLGGDKQVQSVGDANNRNRTLKVVVTVGSGVSFNYGVQTGRGGIIMGNNSQIIGNVYANGDITGSGAVTGTAVAANSAALVADQVNDTPTIPAYSINFRNNSSDHDFAQSFTVTEDGPINKVQFYIKKVGNPTNGLVRIVTDNNGEPSENDVLTSPATLTASSITTNYGWLDIVFSSNPTLYEGQTYWVILDNSSNSATNYFTVGANNGGYANGTALGGVHGAAWHTTSPATLDSYFKIYLGGLTSEINGIAVGTSGVGDAWANTIIGGSVAGTKYCQVGTGCNTTRVDPSPTAFPVSDANIAEWKSEASLGPTISGNYAPADGATLGPAVINGDLSMTIGATLTLTGRVWVKGNVILNNNSTIKLSSAYGTEDEIIVADGTVSISNNADFANSGTMGSYIMVLTTSDCPISSSCGGIDAIDVSNNAGAVILNAQRGTIHLNNNAELVEATGETLELAPNAIIRYQSGLVDMNFSTGPGGAWHLQSWRETE